MKSELEIKQLKEKIIGRLSSINREGISDLMDFLENKSDYFDAPASTKYHGNHISGLMIHCDYLVEAMLRKNKLYNLGISEETIYLTGYLHDLCKVDFYEKAYDIKKHPTTGAWASVPSYKCEEELPLGHGEKSLSVAQDYIKLTADEKMMIRWHMGVFQSHDDIKGFSSACSKCKGVALISSTDFEVDHFLEIVVDIQYLDIRYYNDYVKAKALKEGAK